VTDETSAEHILNQPSATADRAPTADYVRMEDHLAPEPDKRKAYADDESGIKRAAKDLTEARESVTGPKADAEPIDRGYSWLSGDKAGQPVAPNETLTAERAARDLQAVRDFEVSSQQPAPEAIAAGIDEARANYLGQQQPTAQPEQPPVDPAATEFARQAAEQGIDPEIAAAISNPKVRAALESELATVENARRQYHESLVQSAQLAGASLLASFPELSNVPTNQLHTAIQAIQQVNPQRAAAINAHLEKTQSLLNAVKQVSQQQQAVHAQEQQLQSQRMQQFIENENARFENEVIAKEPEVAKRVKENAVQILTEDYGIPKDALAQAWNTTPVLRTKEFQSLVYDAIKYRMAAKEIGSKRDRTPPPPVQKPNVSAAHGSNDGVVDAAMARFKSDPSVQNAAKLLQARRGNR
jgi:hypothetical protein